MGLGPTVEDSCDSGVTIVMTAGVGVALAIDAVAVTRSGSEVGLGEPLHPASNRRIKVPRRSEATLPEALSARLDFPRIILQPISGNDSIRGLDTARYSKWPF